jgi:O-antigen/teichoic acid export membrane protein
MLAMDVPAFRAICVAFPLSGITVVLGAVFQALGHSTKTFVVSLVQMGVLLGSAWAFVQIGAVNAIWWSSRLWNYVSLCFSHFYADRLYKDDTDNGSCLIMEAGMKKTALTVELMATYNYKIVDALLFLRRMAGDVP